MGKATQSLLDEGTYGCVFYPSLKCKKGAKTDGKVSKLTRIVNSEFELDVADKLRKLPDWEKYYILSYEDNCSRRELEKIYEEYKTKCDFLERVKSGQLIQLISPFGGKSLREYYFPSTFSVLGFLGHLAEGVRKMHEIGYGHFDIHEGNVLIDSIGTARLIDFGKSMEGDKVDEDKLYRHTFTFTPSFVWQPPELAVMNAIQEGQPDHLAIQRVIEKKDVFRSIQSILKTPIAEQEYKLRNFINFSVSAQSRRWDAFFRHHWRKFDIWSLGVITINIISHLLIRPEFIEKVWKKEGDILLRVLKGMLVADPRERFTIEKVVSLL